MQLGGGVKIAVYCENHMKRTEFALLAECMTFGMLKLVVRTEPLGFKASNALLHLFVNPFPYNCNSIAKKEEYTGIPGSRDGSVVTRNRLWAGRHRNGC
jgi:hypothetical protein